MTLSAGQSSTIYCQAKLADKDAMLDTVQGLGQAICFYSVTITAFAARIKACGGRCVGWSAAPRVPLCWWAKLDRFQCTVGRSPNDR